MMTQDKRPKTLCLTIKECEFFHVGDARISIARGKGRRFTVWIEAFENIKIEREGYEPKDEPKRAS